MNVLKKIEGMCEALAAVLRFVEAGMILSGDSLSRGAQAAMVLWLGALLAQAAAKGRAS